MTVSQARESARQWVREHAAALPGFCGAYTAGSTNWLAAEAEMPSASDFDVMVVVAGGDMAGARQQFVHSGALLEDSLPPQRAVFVWPRVFTPRKSSPIPWAF